MSPRTAIPERFEQNKQSAGFLPYRPIAVTVILFILFPSYELAGIAQLV